MVSPALCYWPDNTCAQGALQNGPALSVKHSCRCCQTGNEFSQLPRFYVSQPLKLIEGNVTLDGQEGKHAVRVLRLQQGSELELCDGLGALVRGRIASIRQDTALVSLRSSDHFDVFMRFVGKSPPWVFLNSQLKAARVAGCPL